MSFAFQASIDPAGRTVCVLYGALPILVLLSIIFGITSRIKETGVIASRPFSQRLRFQIPHQPPRERRLAWFSILPVSMGRFRRVNRALYLVGVGRCLQVGVGKDGLAGAIDADRLGQTKLRVVGDSHGLAPRCTGRRAD